MICLAVSRAEQVIGACVINSTLDNMLLDNAHAQYSMSMKLWHLFRAINKPEAYKVLYKHKFITTAISTHVLLTYFFYQISSLIIFI